VGEWGGLSRVEVEVFVRDVRGWKQNRKWGQESKKRSRGKVKKAPEGGTEYSKKPRLSKRPQ